jgi:hypothetical protein
MSIVTEIKNDQSYVPWYEYRQTGPPTADAHPSAARTLSQAW